jgi:N-acyl-D-aspartate/D-glutamate deacylase
MAATSNWSSMPPSGWWLPGSSIRTGTRTARADLVVFDPARVRDAATYQASVRHPTGIDDVIVNGRPAILSGSETGERPGRLLRRG